MTTVVAQTNGSGSFTSPNAINLTHYWASILMAKFTAGMIRDIMTTSSKGSPSRAGTRIFRYGQVKGYFIWMLIVDAFFLFMAIWQFFDGEYPASLFFTIGLMVFAWVEVISLKVVSDVSIEPDKISRTLFGRRWISIHWNEVDVIKVTTLLDSKSFILTGTDKSRDNKHLKMVFDNRILGFEELLRLLVAYAEKYKINIVND